MQFKLALCLFYSDGDERRFFQVLRETPGVREFWRHDGYLILNIEGRFMSRQATVELIALLCRYGLPLSSFKSLAASNRRFAWMDDSEAFWYPSMFARDEE